MTLVTGEPERVVSTAGAGPLGVYEVELDNGRTAWFKLTAERADQLDARPVHGPTADDAGAKARAPSNKRRIPHNKQQNKQQQDQTGQDTSREAMPGGAAGDPG